MSFQGQAKRSQYFNATYIAIFLGATCCLRLATLLRHVTRCCAMLRATGSNFKMVKFFMQYRLTRFVQQCCTRASALVKFSIPNMSQHLKTGRPNARNMLRPTMLRYVALKCCNRLPEACKCWANNVGICSMMQSFNRGFKLKVRVLTRLLLGHWRCTQCMMLAYSTHEHSSTDRYYMEIVSHLIIKSE